jgi:hypothetical protein
MVGLLAYAVIFRIRARCFFKRGRRISLAFKKFSAVKNYAAWLGAKKGCNSLSKSVHPRALFHQAREGFCTLAKKITEVLPLPITFKKSGQNVDFKLVSCYDVT